MGMSCDDYDYIEIACLYGYQLSLELSTGETLIGKALTTGIDQSRQEYLLLACKATDETQPSAQQNKQVPLNQLKSITVLSPNARFQYVVFKVGSE